MTSPCPECGKKITVLDDYQPVQLCRECGEKSIPEEVKENAMELRGVTKDELVAELECYWG